MIAATCLAAAGWFGAIRELALKSPPVCRVGPRCRVDASTSLGRGGVHRRVQQLLRSLAVEYERGDPVDAQWTQLSADEDLIALPVVGVGAHRSSASFLFPYVSHLTKVADDA